MKATKSSAPKWNKPISKKAYEKIIAKAKQLLRDVGWLSSWESYLTSYIDAYINDRTCHPNRHDFGEASPAICTGRQKTVTLHNSSPHSFTQ